MPRLSIQRTNTILYCNRFRATVHFYRDVLGLPASMEKSWFVEFRLHADAFLSVADARHATIAAAGGAGLTISLKVACLDTLRDHLLAENVPVPPVRSVWGSQSLYLFDPEGNRIEMWAD